MSHMETVAADTNFYFGLILAVTASIFIGTSFILKKKALLIISRKGCVRAGSGGFAYLKEIVWWCGLLCMGIGEGTNFTAYIFAPASLVTPLGVLSVIVSAVLAAIFLREHLNLLGKLGCLLCLLGSTVLIIHAPQNEQGVALGSAEVLEKLKSWGYLIYLGLVILAILVLAIHIVPKYGHTNLLPNILMCSLVGSLMVMSCKCLGIVIKERFTEDAPETSGGWLLPTTLTASVIAGIFLQLVYLNRALDLFNTSIVTPVYYVLFSSSVLIASSILFQELTSLHAVDIVGLLAGFCTIIVGVVLLNAFRNFQISLSDLNGIMKPKNMVLAGSTPDIHTLSKTCQPRNFTDITRL